MCGDHHSQLFEGSLAPQLSRALASLAKLLVTLLFSVLLPVFVLKNGGTFLEQGRAIHIEAQLVVRIACCPCSKNFPIMIFGPFLVI